MRTLKGVTIIQENLRGVTSAYFVIGDEQIEPPLRSKEEIGQVINTLKERGMIAEETAKNLCDTARNFCILTHAKDVKDEFYNSGQNMGSIITHFEIKTLAFQIA